jgi:hypothetical protein
MEKLLHEDLLRLGYLCVLSWWTKLDVVDCWRARVKDILNRVKPKNERVDKLNIHFRLSRGTVNHEHKKTGTDLSSARNGAGLTG